MNAETRLKDIKKEFGEDPRWKECDDADKEQLLEDRVSGAAAPSFSCCVCKEQKIGNCVSNVWAADMRREKKEADRKRKSEMLEAFAKYFAPNMKVFFRFHFNGAIRYLMATSWLGPETHWRNAEDKIKQEFAE